MKKIINIGNRQITMESTALTSLAYKKLFGEDILATLGTFKQTNITGVEATNAIDSVSQLGFIMAKQADKTPVKELMNLDIEAYYEWLNQFDYGELYDAEIVSEILSVWSGNLTTSVDAKNVKDAQVDN